MPYTTEWLNHGIIWTYTDILTGNELLESNLEIFGDERFDELRYQIVDLRAITAIQATESHMRKIAHLDMAAALTNSRIKIAVVFPTYSIDKRFHQQYLKYTDKKSPWETKDFASLAEAKAWAQAPRPQRQ
jgi:hypothetical protein